MHVYKDKQWESEVHDYGDDYHNPPREDRTKLDKELLKKVKGLKRRYRDFGEYCDAMDILKRYMQDLIDLYGGKKRYKMLRDLKMVKEYIPFKPRLRRIKKNIPYIKKGMKWVDETRINTNDEPIPVSTKNPDDIEIVFSNKVDKKDKDRFFEKDVNRERIAMDLDAIEAYYRGRVKHPTRLSKKAYKRRLKALKREKIENAKPAKQKIEEYYEKKFLGPDYHNDKDRVVYYKGTTLSTYEADELETMDKLKQIGFRLSLNSLTKRSRKVVKRNKKDEKKAKKKKKKNVKLNKRYLDQFQSGSYESFSEFENSMKKLVAKQIRGE